MFNCFCLRFFPVWYTFRKVILLKEWEYYQNRRQKVFNGRLCSSAGGLCVCAGGLDIIKLTKTPLIYSSVSRFNLGGLEALFGGDKPTNPPPVATGLSITAAHVRDHSTTMICSLLKCNWLCCNVGYHIFRNRQRILMMLVHIMLES